MKFTRSKLCFIFACLLLLWSAAPQLALAQDNVVLQWNQAALLAVRTTRLGPPMVARALAVTHTSMFDAWAAYDAVAVGTRLGGPLRRPMEEHTSANKERAVSYAAYRALADLFPSQKAIFDGLMIRLGYDPTDNSTDATPAGVGNVAAAAVLEFRHRDGSNQLGDLNPGAYSDYTGYRPVNDPDHLNDPNRWQPLRQANGTVQISLVPHWGRVAPFSMATGSEIRPDKAPAFFHHQYFGWAYHRQALEVLHLSASLTDREKMIAEYWADGPATETPPGHWNLFAQFVSRRDGHGMDEDVKMFFALSNALLDAGIAVWDCKGLFDYIRPVSAVRNLFAGVRVKAWAGPGQGARLIFGEQWQSYIATPPFGEYISGHSTFSAASAEILKTFSGSDTFGASVTLRTGSSVIEPGLVPAADITLSWATFSEAADQAGISRRYGGIHFSDGDFQGRSMGRRIGAQVWAKAQTYFDGTATQ